MTKIIRLTESDLTKLVKKVIEEQNKSDFPQLDVRGKRLHDKMVIDCLKKAGFSPKDTGGKYEVFMTSSVGGVEYTVFSQQDPKKFVVEKINRDGSREEGELIIGSSTNCKIIINSVYNPK
jgi:hypothetical protein